MQKKKNRNRNVMLLLCCIKDVFNRTNHFTSNSLTTVLIRHHVDVLILYGTTDW